MDGSDKPVIANSIHDPVFTVAQLIDDFAPSNKSALPAQVGACYRIDIDRSFGIEKAGDAASQVRLPGPAPSQQRQPARTCSPRHVPTKSLRGSEHFAQLFLAKCLESELELSRASRTVGN